MQVLVDFILVSPSLPPPALVSLTQVEIGTEKDQDNKDSSVHEPKALWVNTELNCTRVRLASCLK